MNRYKIRIDTSSFNPFRVTQKNWENGTRNDFMYAINQWNITEKNLRDLKNRLCIMLGYGAEDEYYQNYCSKWLEKSYIKYTDRLCGFDRKEIVGAYGFAQGYIDVDEHLSELLKTGKTRIYFKNMYDIRQYSRNYNGCYIEITK